MRGLENAGFRLALYLHATFAITLPLDHVRLKPTLLCIYRRLVFC